MELSFLAHGAQANAAALNPMCAANLLVEHLPLLAHREDALSTREQCWGASLPQFLTYWLQKLRFRFAGQKASRCPFAVRQSRLAEREDPLLGLPGLFLFSQRPVFAQILVGTED